MRYVTPPEFAAALGISVKTLDRWLAAALLPAPVRGEGPKGRPGWRRWPAKELAAALAGRFPVPAAWLEDVAA